MKTLHQTINFVAAPIDVYQALVDPKQQTDYTDAKAIIFPKINGRFEVYDGGIVGTFLELEPGKRIASTWKEVNPKWPAGHYSRVEINLIPLAGGTKLELIHQNIPDGCYDDIATDWEKRYWQPLTKYFEARKLRG
jgi:activator of HSP90 ATPase